MPVFSKKAGPLCSFEKRRLSILVRFSLYCGMLEFIVFKCVSIYRLLIAELTESKLRASQILVTVCSMAVHWSYIL